MNDLRGFGADGLPGAGTLARYGPDAGGLLPLMQRSASDMRGLIKNTPVRGPEWFRAYPDNLPIGNNSLAGRPVYGGGVFMSAAGASGNVTQLIRSMDFGRYWQTVAIPSCEPKTVCTNGAGRWLASCGNGAPSSSYLLSTDHGASWATMTAPSASQFYYGSGYAHGYFFLGAFGTPTVWRSGDGGLTWQSASLPVTNNSRTFTGDGAGRVVCVGEGSTTICYSDNDGASWKAGGVAVGHTNYPLFVNGRLFMVASGNGFCWYSDDFGLSWKNTPLPAANGWLSISYVGGVYFAVSSTDSRVAVSPTGISDWTWAANSLPTVGSASCTVGGGVPVLVYIGTNTALYGLT